MFEKVGREVCGCSAWRMSARPGTLGRDELWRVITAQSCLLPFLSKRWEVENFCWSLGIIEVRIIINY